MILLRLFAEGDLSRQVDARALDEGELKIGREPGHGWAIDDPDRMLSRAHCVVSLRGGAMRLRDTSANGTFLGERLERPGPDGSPLQVGDSFRLGRFVILVEQAPEDARPVAPSPFEAPAPAPDKAAAASPFAAPRGIDPFEPRPARRPDPFGGELAPDPLSGTPDPRRPPGYDDDVWERRAEPVAGAWNAPAAARRHEGHERLIGTDRPWTEPPPAPSESGYGFDAPFSRPLLKPPEPGLDDVRIPTDWDAPPAPEPERPPERVAAPAPPPEPAPAPAPPTRRAAPEPAPAAPEAPPASPGADATAAAMLQAFCAGARLDPRALGGDPPLETMRRLGGVYQQMVLGLGDLLGERTSVKNEYRMARTLIRAEGNNPFKWSPAQRAAVEVLREGGDGFMAGPAAVQASFEDLKKHLLCMLAGLRAALSTTLDALAPDAVEGELEGRSYLIKAQREAALWQEYVRLHAAFREQADDNPDSPVNRAFRAAYERQLTELDSLGGRG